MKHFFIPVLVCLSFSALSNAYGERLPIQTTPPLDQSNNILNYLCRVASDVTHHSLDGINTQEDWEKVREQRYADYLEMMSLTDVPMTGERPPLNVKIVGTIQKEGYKIIKLYYESLPQLYVPADLYIPTTIDHPVPGVIYVCGHSRTQKVHYQPFPRKFAQLGFVCLIIETIQWGEVLGDHWGCYARGWFHWYSRGYTPAGVELWNAIRGLDLLCSLDEVDKDKLGVTGISGGGTQSWYIAAADPRIKVAAPVCGTCTVEAHIHQRTIDGHCDCMMPINTYLRDFHDIGALIAPRPLMIASANRDGLNSIESVRQNYQYVKKIYDLYGASDNLKLVETPGGHSYHETSRTKIFSFFIKHLMGKDIPPEEVGDIDSSEESMLSVDDLRIYVNGPPSGDRTTTIQDSFQKMAEAPSIQSKEDLNRHRDKVITFLKEKTFHAFPAREPHLGLRMEFRSHDNGNGRTTYSFISEEGYRLKIDARWKEEQEEKRPVLLVLRGPGEQRWDSDGFSSGLPSGWTRALFDTRGIGETSWGPELQWHIRRAAAWTGRTIASMQVYDVLRCLKALRQLPQVDGKRIAIAARDEMAPVALYAALLDGNICSVLIQNPPATQNAASSEDGRGPAIEMLNCLRVTDLPQVAGLLCPNQLVFVGNPPDSFSWAKDVYKTTGNPNKVSVVNNLRDWKPE